MKVYNKLVRDKIPEIIEKDGKKAEVIVLSDEGYRKALKKKLVEEVEEYLANDSIQEILDILEVIDAVLKLENVNWEYIFKLKEKKKEENGTFDKRLFLTHVNSKI